MIGAYPLDNGDARVDMTMAYAGIRKNFERAGFIHAAGDGHRMSPCQSNRRPSVGRGAYTARPPGP